MTKNQWLTTEMVSLHAFEVATQNAVESKIVVSRHAFEAATQNAIESKTTRSRHRTEVMTQNLLRGQKNVVSTNINITGNRNDVAT